MKLTSNTTSDNSCFNISDKLLPGLRKTKQSEEGFVLITAMLIMIAVSLLGIAALNTTTFETMIAGNEKWSQEQFFQADSGINQMLALDMEPRHPNDIATSPYNPAITCSQLINDTTAIRWQTLDPDGDGNPVFLFYLQRVPVSPPIFEVMSCATRSNTIASLTAGVEFGLPAGGIGSTNDVGHNL